MRHDLFWVRDSVHHAIELIDSVLDGEPLLKRVGVPICSFFHLTESNCLHRLVVRDRHAVPLGDAVAIRLEHVVRVLLSVRVAEPLRYCVLGDSHHHDHFGGTVGVALCVSLVVGVGLVDGVCLRVGCAFSVCEPVRNSKCQLGVSLCVGDLFECALPLGVHIRFVVFLERAVLFWARVRLVDIVRHILGVGHADSDSVEPNDFRRAQRFDVLDDVPRIFGLAVVERRAVGLVSLDSVGVRLAEQHGVAQ